jgi:NAD(P)-dependent dehydrogenase (short-subunit alcohol dehydrogenase family)
MSSAPKRTRASKLKPEQRKQLLLSNAVEVFEGQAYTAGMPARRLGSIDELARPLWLLASDAGSFINGVALPIDGALKRIWVLISGLYNGK